VNKLVRFPLAIRSEGFRKAPSTSGEKLMPSLAYNGGQVLSSKTAAKAVKNGASCRDWAFFTAFTTQICPILPR
jgi:hypothetical protein